MSHDLDGFEFTVDEFVKGLEAAEKAIYDAARRGVAKASMALLRDAEMEVNMVPLDKGTLRGSGSAFVSNKLVKTSSTPSEGGDATPATSTGLADPPGDLVEGLVGFNTPYAAYLHEGISRFSGKPLEYGHTREKRGRPPVTGTGAKFLSTKLSDRREVYLGIIAAEIEKVLG